MARPEVAGEKAGQEATFNSMTRAPRSGDMQTEFFPQPVRPEFRINARPLVSLKVPDSGVPADTQTPDDATPPIEKRSKSRFKNFLKATAAAAIILGASVVAVSATVAATVFGAIGGFAVGGPAGGVLGAVGGAGVGGGASVLMFRFINNRKWFQNLKQSLPDRFIPQTLW